MPSLTWPSKSLTDPQPARLATDSLIFPGGAGYPHATPLNRLFLGDNLGIISTLLPEWEGRVSLIYADPPFFTNRSYPARIGHDEDSRKPQDWQLAEGYPDHWQNIDAYLDMLYPRLALMYRLLDEKGTLYLHLDWHASPYARLLLDEIFGPERLLNEIVWAYHGPSPIRTAFNRKHDTILAYTKSKDYTFNVDAVREPYNPNTVKTFAASPKAGFGKVPDLARGKVPEDWWYFPVVARLHRERTGYPTQKPEALLERIILASSNPGDMVADFFCGSGTAPLVAARLGRRFLAADLTWRGVQTTLARLVAARTPPFSLEVDQSVLSPGKAPPSHDLNLSARCLDSAIHLAINQSPAFDLDYWELDPDWNGECFRSAAQAARPPGKSQLPLELTIPAAWQASTGCLRLVTSSGERFHVTFDWQALLQA